MAIDMFETRTMLASLEKFFPPKTFLSDTFFPNVETSMTEHIDIDVYKRQRRLAPFVRASANGKQIERTGFDTKSFKPPYIKMEMITTAANILKRPIGQHIYQGNSSPAQRAQEQLGKDLAELRDMIIRREEWMAAKALQTGVVPIVGDGYDAEVDFNFDATHLPTAGTLWSSASADIVKDLRDWGQVIKKDSGLNPDVTVLGSDVVPEFLNNTGILALLDNRRIDIGMLKPEEMPNGASFIGTLRVPGLMTNIWSYDEWYADDVGDLYPHVDADKVIMGSTQARAAKHYGAIEDNHFDQIVSVRFYPRSWIDPRTGHRFLLMQSRPILIPHDIDAFLCATVL